jgi:hypothetical protein
MVGSAIREIAVARTVPLISAAFYEGRVQVWNLNSQRMEGDFPIRKNGLKNLIMHPAGESIVSGFSARRGTVIAYATSDGAILWRRDKIEEGGFLHFDRSGLRVSFSRGRRESVERVDARTGLTLDVLEHTGRYFEGLGHTALLASSSLPNYIIRQLDHEVAIPKLTFALLDVTFGPMTICLTESGGPVRCINCRTGEEIWRHTPPDGSHALNLHYNSRDGFFYGVVWQYQKGHFRYLARFDAQTGQGGRIRDLDSWEDAFSEATQQLVTSAGEIIELSTGQIVGKLAFPRKEYPDPVPTA